ncbi:hypothetical protein SASPL_110707 [Salvia splendens]|uniref:Fatty acid omega-hydroxylase n=1 Tax=Salvia splendens TaxID=180675 RepID=A0A8X8Y7P6_SALSN|nr:hypothetical protein SASPL_110707 [Salvia splendens]
MSIPVFVLALLFLLLGALATRSSISSFFVFHFTLWPVYHVVSYVREVISSSHRPPVAGPIMINQLRRLFDYQIKLALRYRTYRLITDSHSEVYTADPINGEYNRGIMKDLFGEGIFAIDGKKWRHQRKLASNEFSAKVLRDFSCSVFRSNAAKLASKVYVGALANREMDLQDMLMKSATDTMFKVGFGVELDTLSGSDEISNHEKVSNIGLERNLKENIQVIDNFVYNLIHRKREQMRNEEGQSELEEGHISEHTCLVLLYAMQATIDSRQVLQDVKLDTEVRDGSSVDEFVLNLTEAALDKMQYLHAALTETLRLYPAVPVDGKSADEDDILPDGHRIKKGDGISYMPYAMGRMAYIWGEDAEEFHPRDGLKMVFFQGESPFKFTAFQVVEENRNATLQNHVHSSYGQGLPLYAFPSP